MDDHEDHDDERGSGDVFDRRWSNLLDTEADLLREQAMILIETGALSIERPAGTVTAQFSPPAWRQHGTLAWHRRPGLDIEAKPAGDSGRRAGAHGPMVSKYGDRANLIKEVTLTLAVHLAWLEEDE
jgi:hypothetical protein